MSTSSIGVGGHAGALDGGRDGDAAQRRRRHVRERTRELADRRAHGGDEEDGAVRAGGESAIHALDATAPRITAGPALCRSTTTRPRLTTVRTRFWPKR